MTVALYLFALALLTACQARQPGADFSSGVSSSAADGMVAAQRAQEYQRRGDAAIALRYARVAAGQHADSGQWLQLAYLYRDRADWLGMQESLSQVLEIEPGHAEAHYELALLLMPFDLRAAYAHLTMTLDDPRFAGEGRQLQLMLGEIEMLDRPQQSARIGQALAARERWAQAEQAFITSVALQPDFAEAWAYLALVQAQQHKTSATSAARALVLGPNNGRVQFLTGLASRIAGQPAAALPALLFAQSQEPANPAFALELGTLYRQMGDLPTAEYWLRYALDLARDEPSFLRMLAFFYAEEAYALQEGGLAFLRQATAQLPEDVDLLAAYAWALFNSGDPAGALQTLDTVFALHRDSPRGLYYQGRIFQLQGQPEAAWAAFERILTLGQPDGFDELAIRALEELR